jgi:hypothetical protein
MQVRLEILDDRLVQLSTRASKADDCISRNLKANGATNDRSFPRTIPTRCRQKTV